MNDAIRKKVNRFGKTGKTVVTVLLVLSLITAVLSGIAAAYIFAQPGDVMTVHVTSQAEFRIDENYFADAWSMLCDGFTYAGDALPQNILPASGAQVLPPEDTALDADLSFFHQSYSSALVHADGNEKVISAASGAKAYQPSDLAAITLCFALSAAVLAAVLFVLRRLFAVLSVCETPFSADFVSALRTFGYSLLPLALLASIGETLAARFLSAGKMAGVQVQWGILLAFAVTMCLVTVFTYGVQLQKESDETL